MILVPTKESPPPRFCSPLLCDATNKTPLHHAALGGHSDVLNLLLNSFLLQGIGSLGNGTKHTLTKDAVCSVSDYVSEDSKESAVSKDVLLSFVEKQDDDGQRALDYACGCDVESELSRWYT